MENADPIIRAIFARLPPVDTEFSLAQRLSFLRALEAAFGLIYKDAEQRAEHDREEGIIAMPAGLPTAADVRGILGVE